MVSSDLAEHTLLQLHGKIMTSSCHLPYFLILNCVVISQRRQRCVSLMKSMMFSSTVCSGWGEPASCSRICHILANTCFPISSVNGWFQLFSPRGRLCFVEQPTALLTASGWVPEGCQLNRRRIYPAWNVMTLLGHGLIKVNSCGFCISKIQFNTCFCVFKLLKNNLMNVVLVFQHSQTLALCLDSHSNRTTFGSNNLKQVFLGAAV